MLPSRMPRDHVPILLRLTVHRRHEEKTEAKPRWDRDKLAAAAQKGPRQGTIIGGARAGDATTIATDIPPGPAGPC
eukprot:4040667-Pyramimonas_sp.AAC.1